MCGLSKRSPILLGTNAKSQKEPRDSSISNEIESWPEKEWGMAGDKHDPAGNLLMGLKVLNTPPNHLNPSTPNLSHKGGPTV